MSDYTIATARAFYDAIHGGDFDRLFGLLAHDCTIEFPGPSVIPFAGIFRGREKCRIFFDHVRNDVDIREFRQESFMAGDDQVAVTGHLQLRFHATGRDYASDYVHVHTVRNGAITRFRDFQDSAKAAFVCADVATPVR